MTGAEMRAMLYRDVKVGQAINIVAHQFERLFPGVPRNPFTDATTPLQTFLSGMMGSGFGEWRAEKVYATGQGEDFYRVSRHQGGEGRVYVDPDREWMFERGPDGFLHLRAGLGEP